MTSTKTSTHPTPVLLKLVKQLNSATNKAELDSLKAQSDEDLLSQAWEMLSDSRQQEIEAFCQPPSSDLSLQESPPSSPQKPESISQTPTPSETHRQKPQMPKLSLWQISNDILDLEAKLDELSDEQASTQAVDAFLAAYDQTVRTRDEKVDNYCSYILHLEAIAKARREEAERLQSLAEADLNRAQMLKQRLQAFFEQHNLKKLETAKHKLRLQRNGGKSPVRLNEIRPDELPTQFQKVTIQPDLAKIREALEAGKALEFAYLGERGQSLRIS